MNKRIENLEFRWTKSYGKDGSYYPEIVCWYKNSSDEESCYTLLHWVKGSEGWDIRFVGNRPFDPDKFDEQDLWALMRFGQKIADSSYELNRYEKEKR